MQQYDINPNSSPIQVATVQHMPANTPPSPPNSIEEEKNPYGGPTTAVSTIAPALPVYLEAEMSEGEEGAMSPLQRIAMEMEQLEEERRDMVGPLSPSSSRASSVSSRSSGGGQRAPSYRYDKPPSSRMSNVSANEGTEFSFGQSLPRDRQSMSIRSTSSYASSKYRSSNLRKEVLRSPDVQQQNMHMDLFPFVKVRLMDVEFRTPFYGHGARTPDILRREMLSVVFGWNDDIESLVRDERKSFPLFPRISCLQNPVSRHNPGSASGVLLSKWLGDLGADSMASMIGSESMTSSDWMLLALSSMGHDSQKKVGEAFVQRLLEKGDIHPAVAILLGLGEHNDAVEVYVSQGYHMEAVLLTCLIFPADWQRQSFLLKKWGETAMVRGQPELAVRCFACTSVETSEPWFSPAAQDAVFRAEKEQVLGPSILSPPLSPPSATGSSRMANKLGSLKLITTFGDKGAPLPATRDQREDATPMQRLGVGVTPIAESAISPGGAGPWLKARDRKEREPSTARTATPGAYGGRRRFPSKSDFQRARDPSETPLTAARDFASFKIPAPSRAEQDVSSHSSHSRRTSSISSKDVPFTLSSASYQQRKVGDPDHLPSPAHGVFARLRQESKTRNGSRERMPEGLSLQVLDTAFLDSAVTPGLSTQGTESGISTLDEYASRTGAISPPLTGESLQSGRVHARQQRAESRSRAASRDGRTRRYRDPSETRGRAGVKYIKPAKRSPSSPVPMSPDEVFAATRATANQADESYYNVTSPVESTSSRVSRSQSRTLESGSESRSEQQAASPVRASAKGSSRAASRATSRHRSPEGQRLRTNMRGRSQSRKAGSLARSPSSPLPMSPETKHNEEDETQSDGQRVRIRQHSSSRKPREPSVQRGVSRVRAGSSSRRPDELDTGLGMHIPNITVDGTAQSERFTTASEKQPQRRDLTKLTRKELAARELEERRLSLARRPSAPAIPLPGQSPAKRPGMAPRHHTELGDSPHSFLPPYSGPSISRSQTVDPEAMMRYGPRTTGTSTPSAPIGLPATPRAMRHPRYMSSDPNERENIPAVPDIPDTLPQLTPAVFGQPVKSAEPQTDTLAPLLPSTVYGQKGPQAPTRSASAPPEKMGLPSHPAYKAALPHSSRRASLSRHVRKISPTENEVATQPHSPPMVTGSIDQALHDSQVIIIEEPEAPAIVLPELQHLAGPPPPPPPPTIFSSAATAHQPTNSLGVINIAIEEDAPMIIDVTPELPRATTASPSMHRRGRGSISNGSVSHDASSFGSRFRTIGDRMRSTSRSRAKSPPMESSGYKPSPYETVLPPMPRRESLSSSSRPAQEAIPPPPPPPPEPPVGGPGGPLVERVVPPERSQNAMGGYGGYRHPKEIRANMPPETLQQGVYQPGGMI